MTIREKVDDILQIWDLEDTAEIIALAFPEEVDSEEIVEKLDGLDGQRIAEELTVLIGDLEHDGEEDVEIRLTEAEDKFSQGL